MKKITLLSLLVLVGLTSVAQVSSLSENFDVACVTVPGTLNTWNKYTPVPGTYPQGAWTCTPNYGRPSDLSTTTPGIMCTGIWSSTDHLDTSYLITPLLNFNGISSTHVYLRFDAKTDIFTNGGHLAVIKAPSSDTFFQSTALDSDLAFATLPVIGIGDASGWVTHQVDLSPYINGPSFYIGFRYTSSVTTGSIWYLDNINTSTTRLSVPVTEKGILPLKVLGNSTPNKITLTFAGDASGNYHLSLYDMMGREVYKEVVNGQNGEVVHYLNDLNLMPGMYFIKMGNESSYGVVKVIIQ